MAYSFDGTTRSITSSSQSLVQNNGATMAVWCRAQSFDNNGANGYNRPAALTNSAGFWGVLIGTWAGVSGVHFYGWDTAAKYVSQTISTGQWYHLAMTCDGSTLRGYVDGVEVGSTAIGNLGGGLSGALYLGRSQPGTGTRYLDGGVGEAATWFAALTADEIATLARGQSPLKVRKASLALWYRLISSARLQSEIGSATLTGNSLDSAAWVDHPPVPGYGRKSKLAVYRPARMSSAAATGRGHLEVISQHNASGAAVVTGRGELQAVSQHDATGAAVIEGRGAGVVEPAPAGASSTPEGTGRGETVATCSPGQSLAPLTTGAGSIQATAQPGGTLAAVTSGAGSAEATAEHSYVSTPVCTARGGHDATGTHEYYIRATGTGRGEAVASMRADSNNVRGTGRGHLEAAHTTERTGSGATTGRGTLAAICSHGLTGEVTGTGRGTSLETGNPGGVTSPRITGRGHARTVARRNQDGEPIATGRGSNATTGRPGAIIRATGTGRGGQAAEGDAVHPSRPQVQGRGEPQAVTSKGFPSSVNSTGRGAGAATHTTERTGSSSTTGRGGQVAACSHAATGTSSTTGTGTSQVTGSRNQDGAVVGTGRGMVHAFATQHPVVIGAQQVGLAAIVAAFRTNNVAHAAECDVGLWTSTTAPRVFDNLRGYAGARHRGRLPFVEIAKGTEDFTQRASDLGNAPTRWVVMVHVGGLNVRAAETRARAILATGLAALRASGYAWLGDAEAAAMAKDPLGYVLACGVELLHTYDPGEHNVVMQGEP